jgi:hypothetical protein
MYRQLKPRPLTIVESSIDTYADTLEKFMPEREI